METLLRWLAQYGYVGLFASLVFGIAGLPIPDETFLVFSGYLVSRGQFHPVLTWVTAVAGSVGGITLSYIIGRTAGYGFVHRYGRYIHFSESQLRKVEEWFERIGHWLLTVGYFIPGVRHFTALVAGMSGMPWKPFAKFAYPGAVLWVSSFLALGYFLGDQWQAIFETIHKYMILAAVILALIALAIWYFRSRKSAPNS
jgi:membrane protein DedA with SNARE-associated domain